MLVAYTFCKRTYTCVFVVLEVCVCVPISYKLDQAKHYFSVDSATSGVRKYPGHLPTGDLTARLDQCNIYTRLPFYLPFIPLLTTTLVILTIS